MRPHRIVLTVLISILFLWPVSASGQTVWNTHIRTDVTWTLSGSPYLVTQSITIGNSTGDARLTIEPGVEVQISNGETIRVGVYAAGPLPGALQAVGTAAEPILFTSEAGAGSAWGCLIFDALAESAQSPSHLEYCIIEKAGNAYVRALQSYADTQPTLINCEIRDSESDGIDLKGSLVQNCSITDCAGTGVRATGTILQDCTVASNGADGIRVSGSLTMSNTEVDGNAGHAIALNNRDGELYLSGNTYTANGFQRIYVPGGTIPKDLTWPNDGIPYYVSDNLAVWNSTHDARLTIEPGVTVQFESKKSLTIGNTKDSGQFGGALHAVGTAAEPITFTWDPDNQADWNNVYFNVGTDHAVYASSMEHCAIEHAGSTSSWALYSRAHTEPTLKNCQIAGSASGGLYVLESLVEGCSITGSAEGGVYAAGATLKGCTISDNQVDGIIANSGTIVMNCSIRDNLRLGVKAFGSMSIIDSEISTNYQGAIVLDHPSYELTMANNVFVGNRPDAIIYPRGSITSDVTWGYSSIPYQVHGDVTIRSATNLPTLTIDPGTTIQFFPEASLTTHTDGAIHAVGTESLPITFTAWTDTASAWDGIEVSSQHRPSRLEHCVIEKGEVSLDSDTWLELRDTVIRDSPNAGLNISGFASSTTNTQVIERCTIVGSGQANLRYSILGSNPSILFSNCIIANSLNGPGVWVNLGSAELPLFECCNVWGNAGGDYTGTLPGGDPFPDPTGTDGNISLDPQFVDYAGGNLHLQPSSPCLPFTSPNATCDQIGALGTDPGLPTELRVLSPSGTPPVEWYTPRDEMIYWSYTGSIAEDHFELAYSTDGGQHYRALDAVSGAGPVYGYLWSVPPIGTSHLRIKITAVAGDGSHISETESDEVVLYNMRGVAFQYYNDNYRDAQQNQYSESRAVIKWNPAADALRYRIDVMQDDKSSCFEDPFPYGFNVAIDPDPTFGSLPTTWEIPSPFFENMVASRYKVEVSKCTAGDCEDDSWEPHETVSLYVCKLGDQDPWDNEFKQPVVFVHGWTGNADTWFRDEKSPLIESLILGDGSPGSKRRPWTIEYPNIGGIRFSAGALGEAIQYIQDLTAVNTTSIVAHSMGGLVSRTLLQGAARWPRFSHLGDSAIGYGQPELGIDRLVTLASPHLGVPHAVTNQGEFVKSFSCSGVIGSAAVEELENDSSLIIELSATPMPTNLEYLFAAGTSYRGERWLPHYRGSWLDQYCPHTNDATVDACSASAGHCQGTLTPTGLNIDPRLVTTRLYGLGHDLMAKPGSEPSLSSSLELEDDVLEFLRVGGDELSPSLCPTRITTPYVFHAYASTVYQLKDGASKSTKIDDSARPRFAMAKAAVGVSGAQILLQPADAIDTEEGVFYLSDADGQATASVEPGAYTVRISAPGYRERVEAVDVAAGGDAVIWTTDLEPEPGYSGPTQPLLVLNDGASTTTDSLVTLTLGCENATELQLSETSDFSTAVWEPYAASDSWEFSGIEGFKILFARYRDGAGTLSGTVSASIYLGFSEWASLSVESTPPGAEIILDDQATGQVTPTTFDALDPGYHRISLHAPGQIVSPASTTVLVSTGGSEVASFNLSPAPAPEPVDLASLGSSDYLNGLPFNWDASLSEGAQGPLFYNVTLSADSLQNSILWGRIGVSGTELAMDAGLADSTSYFISIEPVNSYGSLPLAGTGTRGFHLDQTPPDVSVFSPSAFDTLYPGTTTDLASEALDWSGPSDAVALLSLDGGASYADTVVAELWASSLEWMVPAYGRADDCLLQLQVTDVAGNIGVAYSGAPFTIFDGVTAVDGDLLPTSFAFALPRANPFSVQTLLSYDIARSGPVSIAIFDVRGRLIKTLVDEMHSRGRYTTAWDGTDARGRRVSAGSYYLRLRSMEFTKSRKVLYVK